MKFKIDINGWGWNLILLSIMVVLAFAIASTNFFTGLFSGIYLHFAAMYFYFRLAKESGQSIQIE